MPSPTPAEALALLREVVEAGSASRHVCDLPHEAFCCHAVEFPSTLAGLVAELYEALGHEMLGKGMAWPRLFDDAGRCLQCRHGESGMHDGPCGAKALRATSLALVAWAGGLGQEER